MKKHDIFKRLAALAAVFLTGSVLLTSCGARQQENNREDEKLSVVTTLFPYYDFARAVAGDRIDLKLILPPGQESHSFEPTAADLIAMEEADVLICNGGESEQWVKRVLESRQEEGFRYLAGMDAVSLRREETSEHMKQAVHEHEEESPDAHDYGEEEEHGHDGTMEYEIEYDEHIWTSPVNAILLVEAVRDTLMEAAPQYEEEFSENAERYIAKLRSIDQEIRRIVQEGQKDILVFADRFPFLYFVKEYGLRYDAAFSGCSSDTEPSAATIAGLIDLVEEEELPVIYHVEQSSQKTALIIEESTGAEILEFHSCHNVTKEEMDSGLTYVDLMKKNIENLKKGLIC